MQLGFLQHLDTDAHNLRNAIRPQETKNAALAGLGFPHSHNDSVPSFLTSERTSGLMHHLEKRLKHVHVRAFTLWPALVALVRVLVAQGAFRRIPLCVGARPRHEQRADGDIVWRAGVQGLHHGAARRAEYSPSSN